MIVWFCFISICMICFFCCEIICLHKRLPFRPSSLIDRFSTIISNSIANILYYTLLLSDFGKLIIDVALVLRERFFAFIPKDIILQAYHNSKNALRHMFTSPIRGVLNGANHAFRVVNNPIVTGLVFMLFVLVMPVLLDLFLITFNLNSVSDFNFMLAQSLYDIGKDFGMLFTFVFDIKAFVVRIAQSIFYYLPITLIQMRVVKVYESFWHICTYPWIGFLVGLCSLIGGNADLCTNTILINQQHDITIGFNILFVLFVYFSLWVCISVKWIYNRLK